MVRVAASYHLDLIGILIAGSVSLTLVPQALLRFVLRQLLLSLKLVAAQLVLAILVMQGDDARRLV